MQVDVNDIVLDRMMLDVGEKRQVLVDLLACGVGDFDIDEDVFAGGRMEERGELLRLDLDRAGTDRLVLGHAVKHAGNPACLAHGFQSRAADTGAL